MRFNADDLAEIMPEVRDLEGSVVRPGWTYWPRVDVTITAGDSLARSKQATLATLQAISAARITAENWRLLAAQLEVLDLPGKQDIIADWESRFASAGETRPADPAGEIPGAAELPAALPAGLGEEVRTN